MKLLLALALTFLLAGCGGSSSSPPIQADPAGPTQPLIPLKRPVRFGYYGAFDDEVLDHVTTVFVAKWGDTDPEVLSQNLLRAKTAGVADAIFVLDWLCFTPDVPKKYKGVEEVKPYLEALRSSGVLDMITFLYPHDEPEGYGITSEDMLKCCEDLRALWPGPKLAVIYGDHIDRRGLAGFDLIGIDSYDHGTDVFMQQYEPLKAALLPHQRLMIVPGGSSPWRETIQPFYDYAAQNERVDLICPFLWTDQASTPGIRSNGMAPQYEAVGLACRASLSLPV